MKKRLLSPEKLNNDNFSLRPILLQDFIGQQALKHNLAIFIQAAKNREEAIDHILFYGPPGLGKTSLAQVIANEMGANFKATSGPMLSKAADLAAILTNLQKHDILFIDEIHRLNTNVEEILYSAMEDFVLDIIIGEGAGARSVRIDLPHFTLIGATTRLGLISNPLRDRFGIPLRLSFYQPEELSQIIIRAALLLGTEINNHGATEIANRARGTPRIALRLLKRIRDFASVEGKLEIDRLFADQALKKLEVDQSGLDNNDYRYLKFISDNYNGGPVGIETIAAALAEQREAIEEAIEPYLIQIGLLQRTSRGRIITDNAFIHLGLPKPDRIQNNQLSFLNQDSEDFNNEDS